MQAPRLPSASTVANHGQRGPYPAWAPWAPSVVGSATLLCSQAEQGSGEASSPAGHPRRPAPPIAAADVWSEPEPCAVRDGGCGGRAGWRPAAMAPTAADCDSCTT